MYGRDVSWTFDLNESWQMRPATSGDLIVFMEFLPYLFGLDSPLLGRGAIATRALTTLLAEALDERRLLIVAATCQAFPVACMAEVESLDEIPTDVAFVGKLWVHD